MQVMPSPVPTNTNTIPLARTFIAVLFAEVPGPAALHTPAVCAAFMPWRVDPVASFPLTGFRVNGHPLENSRAPRPLLREPTLSSSQVINARAIAGDAVSVLCKV